MSKHSYHKRGVHEFQIDVGKEYDHLFRKYFPALCYFAKKYLKGKHDPEDLVMDCFAKLWEKRIQLTNIETAKTFLYTTVRNACIDLLRKKNLPTISIDPHLEEIFPDIEANFTTYIIETEVMREIIAAAETLPTQIRKVFDLYFIEGKNEREISEELHTSYHTVRNQRQRAIALLKGKLQVIRKQSLLFSGLLFWGGFLIL